MAVEFLIAGVDRIDNINMRSVTITESLPARGDQLSFEMIVLSSEIAIKPLAGNTIELKAEGVVIFGGEVATVNEAALLNPDAYSYQVTCSDWTRRLDRRLVVKEKLGPGYAGPLLNSLTQEFAPEFTSSGFADGLFMGEVQVDYQELSSIYDQFAAASGYAWFIKPDKAIFFGLPDSAPTPLPGNIYDVDADLYLGNFTWEEDVSQIKNRIYLKDALIADAGTETKSFTSDGVSSFVPLYNEPFSVDTSDVVSYKPDGSVKQWNISLDPLHTDQGTIQGDPDTCYLCIINVGVRFPLPDGEHVGLEPGEVVDITTKPMRDDIVFSVEDINSQKMMAIREGMTWNVNNGGIYEHIASLQGARLGDANVVEAYGQLLLSQLAWPEVRGSFQTQQINGWKAGQSFFLKSSKRDLYDSKVFYETGNKTNQRVWIQSVRSVLRQVGFNMVGNPGFEASGTSEGVVFLFGSGPTAARDSPWTPNSLAFNTTSQFAGRQSLIVEGTSQATTTPRSFRWRNLDGTKMRVNPDTIYVVSASIKRSGSAGDVSGHLGAFLYDKDGNYISHPNGANNGNFLVATTSWASGTFEFTTPSNAYYADPNWESTTTNWVVGKFLHFDSVGFWPKDGLVFDHQIEFSNKAVRG